MHEISFFFLFQFKLNCDWQKKKLKNKSGDDECAAVTPHQMFSKSWLQQQDAKEKTVELAHQRAD